MTDDKSADSDDKTVMIASDAIKGMEQIFQRYMARSSPFGWQGSDENIAYHPLPYKPVSGDKLLLTKAWRIEFELNAEKDRWKLGLDLYSDVVLGRGESRPGRIIVDLDPYNARDLGVSREHLMLRPTPTRLFAIDQGSTNRTAINAMPSGRGLATELHDKDMIALGNLVLVLHIVSKPDTDD